jgi:hypothetical protein
MNGRSLTMRSLTAVMALTGAARAAAAPAERQVLELRTYRFASEAKLATFAGLLAQAYVPALNRAGVTPVGIFRARQADNPDLKLAADELQVRVLLPHPDLASVAALPEKLAADAVWTAQAKTVLGTPMSDPLYERFETQLMLGFTECPRVVVPTMAADRVLQLRIYESHNDERALRKIEMFNEGGEIALFRRVGIQPVFFGQSLAGTLLPNLTYMVSFENPAAKDAAWATFIKHPEWEEMKTDPKYAETVSRITNLVLRPLPGSQI